MGHWIGTWLFPSHRKQVAWDVGHWLVGCFSSKLGHWSSCSLEVWSLSPQTLQAWVPSIISSLTSLLSQYFGKGCLPCWSFELSSYATIGFGFPKTFAWLGPTHCCWPKIELSLGSTGFGLVWVLSCWPLGCCCCCCCHHPWCWSLLEKSSVWVG